MRRRDSYIRKYGLELGTFIYTTLQKEAAQARWKAFYRDRGPSLDTCLPTNLRFRGLIYQKE